MMTEHGESRVERMMANYEARLNVGQCGAPVRSALRVMAERHSAAMERLRRIRAQTNAFYDKLDLLPVQRRLYFGYACKLAKVKDKGMGEHALREEGRIVVMTWAARGLDPAVLLRIARELFDLELREEKPERTNQE